ncbi:hypothetical protein ACGFMK_41020 [Amycolatopsis sp. NPDC049252]|uniref:hypothetical protein n=1 Tax=Amycolatopsis sp. NPDC049252 TaxID=3363933 RepID=UPI003715C039
MISQASSRRRKITFNGSTVTIRADIKKGMFGDKKANSFPISAITNISNNPPGFSGPGVLKFTVNGKSTEVLDNPAGGGDKVDMQTFCYGTLEKSRVAKLVEKIEKAMQLC